MNQGNEYELFLPAQSDRLSEQNPRLHILQKFRKISLIMRSDFLTHKRNQVRYGANYLSGKANDNGVKQASRKMIEIMQKMHSPRSFQTQA